MSSVSKYYRLTEQIMLEYIPCDLDEMNNFNENISRDLDEYIQNVPSYYIYEGKDTNIYLSFEQLPSFMKFPDESDSEHFYPGKIKNLNDSLKDYAYTYSDSIEINKKLFFDRIRLHFIYGFNLDSLLGLALSVKAEASYKTYEKQVNSATGQYLRDKDGNYIYDVNSGKNKTEKLYLTLIDYFFPKESLKGNNVKLLANPLYLNSKFYDRYIELKIPSYYYLASSNDISLSYNMSTTNESEPSIFILNINTPIFINFATVSNNNILNVINENNNEKSFILDPIVQVAIKPKNNSDYFNVAIYENPYENNILFYPTYGEGNNVRDLDIEIMSSIESGSIPMMDDGYEEIFDNDYFQEIYGVKAFKWIIFNELSIIYNYRPNISPDNTNTNISYSYKTTYNNTIDYTNRTSDEGQFWRSSFVPSIHLKNNMVCSSIVIQYTCRLVNRCTGALAIRTASITLNETSISRYMQTKVELTGISTFKVINRIQNNNIYSKQEKVVLKEKYIRSYYDATDLVAKDMDTGLSYTQGQMTLRLKKSSTNYCLRLFNLNNDNVRVPYDLTGPYTYKLVFPGVDGRRLEIKPNNDNTTLNLGVGLLVYYITSDQVKKIMNVREQDRYFAIILDTEGTSAQETTLYEGKVDYYK